VIGREGGIVQPDEARGLRGDIEGRGEGAKCGICLEAWKGGGTSKGENKQKEKKVSSKEKSRENTAAKGTKGRGAVPLQRDTKKSAMAAIVLKQWGEKKVRRGGGVGVADDRHGNDGSVEKSDEKMRLEDLRRAQLRRASGLIAREGRLLKVLIALGVSKLFPKR